MPAGLGFLGSIYGWAASRRRAGARRHPERVRRLSRPVVSIGNLSVGGSGKTPLTVAVAQALAARGERPAILSRGYARRGAGPGVVVVSDRHAVQAGVETSGDEPQLMARRLPGVPVLVSTDRHAAGVVAEREFGCTVHLLDDGFQHLGLARAADVLLLSEVDVRGRVLPAGRLREPVASAWLADAWATFDASPESLLAALAAQSGTARGGRSAPPLFALTATVGAPLAVVPWAAPVAVEPGPVVAVAGIANPARFFASARAAGYTVTRQLIYRDHHWFTADDWRAIAAAAAADGARAILTTEKDAVRLAPLVDRVPAAVPVAYLPQTITLPEPFTAWLAARVEAARC